eukprot:590569-Prymnesium_polylepis.1
MRMLDITPSLQYTAVAALSPRIHTSHSVHTCLPVPAKACSSGCVVAMLAASLENFGSASTARSRFMPSL